MFESPREEAQNREAEDGSILFVHDREGVFLCVEKPRRLMGQVYVCVNGMGEGFRCGCLELSEDRGGASEWRLCNRADQLKCLRE